MSTNGFPNLLHSFLENDSEGLRSKLYNKDNVNMKDSCNQNSLHLASYFGNTKDNNGVTPLLKASASNSFNILKILLDSEADIKCRDDKWNRSFHVCASHDSLPVLARSGSAASISSPNVSRLLSTTKNRYI